MFIWCFGDQIVVFSLPLLCVKCINCSPFDLSSPVVRYRNSWGLSFLLWLLFPLLEASPIAFLLWNSCLLSRQRSVVLPALLLPLLPIRAVADTFQSVEIGEGGVMPGWGSSKAASWRKDQAALPRRVQDRLLGHSVSDSTDALTEFQHCLGLRLWSDSYCRACTAKNGIYR